MRQKGKGSARAERDSNELGQVDGVDLLVNGVKAEEECGRGARQRIGGAVGVGKVVASERDDDLGAAGRKDALAGVSSIGVADIPEGLDEGCEGGMGVALEVKHGICSWRKRN